MRRLVMLGLALVLAHGCGGTKVADAPEATPDVSSVEADGDTTEPTTTVPTATTQPATTQPAATGERAGGTLFVGTFDSGPGYGPGEFSLRLDESGDAITELSYAPGLDDFVCSNGSVVSGGGWTLHGRIVIDSDGSFATAVPPITGVFASATEVSGTYDLRADYQCAFVMTWTATSEPATETAPSDELEQDTALIGEFWAAYGEAWDDGVEGGIDWIAAHNHPDMAFTRDDLACAYAGVPSGYREQAAADLATVRRADEWVLPPSTASPSPIDGMVPRGRVYEVDVEYTFALPGADPDVVAATTHVAILPGDDGADRVWMFFSPGC